MEGGCRLLLEQLYYLSQKNRLDKHILVPEQVAAILESRVEDTNTVVNFLEASGYVKCGRAFGKAVWEGRLGSHIHGLNSR